ncbi:MAG: hypothetical protein ACLT8E_07225 [Akkermansia sp.]
MMESGVLKNNLLYIYAAADGSVQSVNMTQGAWGEQGAPALVMTNKGDLEFTTTIYGTDPVHYAKARLALTSGKNTELLNGPAVADQVDRHAVPCPVLRSGPHAGRDTCRPAGPVGSVLP